MTRIVSTINLKGGVGKTTLTVALAEFLAEEKGKKVLVIDIDPQTNASVALIDQERWRDLNKAGKTLSQLFTDKFTGTSRFKIEESIVKKVSNLNGGINGLDLLPSSLDLIDIQDRLPLIPSMTMYRGNPVTVLKEAMDGIISEGSYDYILIDCPPNLGLITQNALKISDSYIIPVIPDILSSLGIPQIIQRIKNFGNNWSTTINPIGIVFTKVRSIRLHDSTARQIRSDSASGLYPKVWTTEIKEASRTGEAFDYNSSPNTLKQKYGYGSYYETYESLCQEFVRECPS